MKVEELITELEYELDFLKCMRDYIALGEAYVVSDETHVHVRDGYGIKQTDLALITPFTGRLAKIFYSKQDVKERGMNYSPFDENDEIVELKIEKADEFYSRVIEMTENTIKQLKLATEQ